MPYAGAKQTEELIFTVDTLLKHMGGDQKARAVVAKIVRDAVATGYEPMELASAAIREKRYSEAAKAFHGLRGSIGTLGSKRFVTAALAIEVALIENCQNNIPSLLVIADNEFRLLLEHANAWLAQNDDKQGRII